MSKADKRPRLKLIFNPAAGNTSETENNLKLARVCLENNGFKVDMARAKPKAKATPLARKATKEGYKLVVAMGGDGTVEAVMRGLTGSKTRLGIVPTGIENNIARSLGIPLELERACHLIASEHVRKMDVGEVKAGKGKWMPFFEMVGVGYAAAVVPPVAVKRPQLETSQNSKDAGVAGSNETPVSSKKTPKAILDMADGQKMELETRLVLVSNTPVFGKKFMVPPPEFLEDGLLDISVFQGFTKADLHGYYSKMKNGGYAGDGNIQHYQSRCLKVSSSPRMKITVDGVELGKGNVSMRMRPGALRVIAMRDERDLLEMPGGVYENPEVVAAPSGNGNGSVASR